MERREFLFAFSCGWFVRPETSDVANERPLDVMMRSGDIKVVPEDNGMKSLYRGDRLVGVAN